MSNQHDEGTHLLLKWLQNLDNPTSVSVSAPTQESRTGSKLDKLALEFVAVHFPDNVWPRSHPLVVKSATVTDLEPYQPEPTFTGHYVKDSTKLNDFRASSAFLSEEFEAGGFLWRMLFMPHGHPNNATAEGCSFYLERVADLGETHKLAVCAQFALAVCHYPDMNPYHLEYTHARFTNLEPLHGFRHFCGADSIFPPASSKPSTNVRPILENGRGTIMASVRVLDDPSASLAEDYFGNGSRQRTGYMGLRSDRRLPCLSAVVQMLFTISSIRQALYKIADDATLGTYQAVVGELSSIFQRLRDGTEPADLSRLQRMLKVNVQGQLNPKDVLLLHNTLVKELVTALEGSREAEIINRLFEGKTREHISLDKSDCLIDVVTEDITSASEEKATRVCPVRQDTSITRDFQNICFDIAGKQNLRDLLLHYTQGASLIKDAVNPFVQRRSAFLALPPVLRIQLTYPISVEEAVLLDLPEIIEFADWMDPVTVAYDSQQQWVYYLHAVVRHDQNRDLYYTFIKHGRESAWLRFSEELVDVANPQEGEGRVCFLSYVREPLMDVILKRDPERRELSPMGKKIRAMREESLSFKAALKIGPSDANLEVETRSHEHLYEIVDIMSDESFARHSSLDIAYFGNEGPGKESWKSIHVLRLEPFEKFQRRLAQFYGIPEEEMQFWLVLPPLQYRGKVLKRVTVGKRQELVSDFLDQWSYEERSRKRLYIRATLSITSSKAAKRQPLFQAPQQCQVLVMLKAFDIQKGTFFGLKSVEHDPSRLVSSLVPLFVDALSWPKGANPVIYKESGQSKINPLWPAETLQQLGFADGTCVCVLVDEGRPFKDYDPKHNYGVGITKFGDLWHVDPAKLQTRIIGSAKEKPRDPEICRECGERGRCRGLCQYHFLNLAGY